MANISSNLISFFTHSIIDNILNNIIQIKWISIFIYY